MRTSGALLAALMLAWTWGMSQSWAAAQHHHADFLMPAVGLVVAAALLVWPRKRDQHPSKRKTP